MMSLCGPAKLACFAILVSTISLGTTPPTSQPKGDGITDDTAAINALLKAAAGSCATVQLSCTKANKYKVSSSILVPECVKFVGACGGIPDEGSPTTVGTTLVWASTNPGPVVSFHDAPGASLSRISIDCQNVANAIGIQYDSDDKPASSFINIDTLMIKGCHQSIVFGLPDPTPKVSVAQCASNGIQLGCYEADQFKLERYRILGNLSDPTGEGIQINSANAAQGSLISNGNIQGVNIGIHIIMTNGGLVIQSSNMGSVVGTSPTFLVIEPNVAVSPTLINDEVEGTGNLAVVDHGCNPLGTPGNPVWLYNAWNSHPIIVDGCENITSISNLSNSATVANGAAHILSLNETGWTTGGTATLKNLTDMFSGTATFGDSLIDHNVIAALGPACPGFPSGVLSGDLVACEGNRAGRLYLGTDLMLLNNGDGTLDTAGLLRIQTGLYQDGSGLKHQAVSTGSIAAGTTANLPMTWTTPFADANYQAICTVQDNTGSLQAISTSLPATNRVTVFVKNNDTSNAHTGSLACIAIHN
jgi:hypothetical protein